MILDYVLAGDFRCRETACPDPCCQAVLLEKHVVVDDTTPRGYKVTLWCLPIFKTVCQVSKSFLKDAMHACTRVGWLEVRDSGEGRKRDTGSVSRASPVKVGLLRLMSIVRSTTISAAGCSDVNLAPHVLARYFPHLQIVTFFESFAHARRTWLWPALNRQSFLMVVVPGCAEVVLTSDEISRLQNELHFPGNKHTLLTATAVGPLAEHTVVFGSDYPAVEVFFEVTIRCRSIQQAQGSGVSLQAIKATLLKLVLDLKTEERMAARVHIT